MKEIMHGFLDVLGKDFRFIWEDGLRPMCAEINKRFPGQELTGVEIGVNKGRNAAIMLKKMNLKMLYLIDPKVFHGVKRKLAKFDNYIFLEKKSKDAVNDIPDGLDFVYIDGDHSFQGVLDDIKNYLPKVREGGILGGHDFGNPCEDVSETVMRFAIGNNVKLYFKDRDWWMIK